MWIYKKTAWFVIQQREQLCAILPPDDNIVLLHTRHTTASKTV
jgi:hypothetical protein